MNKEIATERIEDFWEWFYKMEGKYKQFFTENAVVDRDQLVEAMNNRVLDFGMFSWEIGPTDPPGYYLTISPGGNKELLSISKSIMQAAPALRDWVFYPAKPAKPTDLAFNLYDSFMIERRIDAADWYFALKDGPDFSKDIMLEAHSIKTLDEETQKTAGDLVVIRMIGEERKIKQVNKVLVFDKLPERYRATKQPIFQLSKIWK